MENPVKSLFLDSGAFTQLTKSLQYYKENKCDRWAYYNTKEFWEYIDRYASFIKEYKLAVDLYANLDVIGNPELTWRNQKYLEEKHGLTPVPVVHFRTDIKWLKKYIKERYELIGLGGLVGNSMKQECKRWVDDCFDFICDTPERLPKVKIHGFGVMGFSFLLAYPWWSTDSAAWDKAASYGSIYIPHKRKGKFVFDIAPYSMRVSDDSPHKGEPKNHFYTLSKMEINIIKDWLDFIKIPIGKIDKKTGKIIEKGITTFHTYRRIANIYYFQLLSENLPKWPTPFIKKKKRTLI